MGPEEEEEEEEEEKEEEEEEEEKHSEEGGQCYCNPYNPFAFKNKHCRQAWVDRGWMCPWTPGDPIPGSTINNAMEIELPWMRDTC